MRFGRSYQNRKTKYFLGKWYELEQSIEHLDAVQMVQAKILYASLRTLDDVELEFLAAKYRTETRPFVADPILAKENGLTLDAYRNKRVRIEDKLRPSIIKNVELYREEMSNSVQLDYVK